MKAMEKIGKMIRDAGPGTPATVKPDYKKQAAPKHTYAEPDAVFNEHIKEAQEDITADEMELLFLKQAEAESTEPKKDPADILEKDAAKSGKGVMDGYSAEAVVKAVNGAGDLDAKLKAYASSSKGDKVAPAVVPGKSEASTC
jgi:hypothetical protein